MGIVPYNGIYPTVGAVINRPFGVFQKIQAENCIKEPHRRVYPAVGLILRNQLIRDSKQHEQSENKVRQNRI